MKQISLRLGLILLALAGTSTTLPAYYLDTPHNESNGIYCYTCHEMAAMTLSAAEWASRTALNPDDTLKNAVCNSCHAPEAVNPLRGPVKKLHASSTTGSASTWSTECTQCHDVHSQGQLDWSAVDSGKLYLVTGEFLVANGPLTYTDLAHSTTGYDYTSIGFNPDPAILKIQAGWEDKSTWNAKGGNIDATRAVDGSRGLILVPDKMNHVETFEITAVIGNVIRVKGRMVKDAVNGGSFGIFYGQALKSSVMPNGGGSVADYRDVKFFAPKLLAGTAGGYVDLTAGAAKPQGLCQVCHEATAFWNSNGANATHNPGVDCDSCHDLKTGAGGGGADHALKIGNYAAPGVDCSNCHYTADARGLHPANSCSTCHTAVPPALNATVMSRLGDNPTYPVTCAACHPDKPAEVLNGVHGGHPDSDFVWNGNCADCHSGARVVADVHGNTCTLCHDTRGSNGYSVRKIGDGANGIDGTAVAATPVSTCTGCHSTQTSAMIHHDTKNGLAASSCTVSCHVPGGLHGGDHAAKVAAAPGNCGTSCHPAEVVAGSATGIPLNPATDKVHNDCLTCHQLVGAVVSANTTTAKAPLRPVGGGSCVACHGLYFLSHVKADHLSRVSEVPALCSTACHPSAAVVGTASTVPLSPATDKVHNGCTTCHHADGSANAPTAKAPQRPAGGGTCVACHGTYFYSHIKADHINTVREIPASCSLACHPSAAVVGTATTVPLSPAPDKVHNACATCHHADGSANATTLKAPLRPAGGGTCVACHGEYFASHTKANHESLVADSASCNSSGCHTVSKGTATTVPVDGTPHTRLHDTCATCHAANGELKSGPIGSAPLMPAGTAATNDGGGACLACHSTFTLASHTNHNHDLTFVPAADVGNSTEQVCATCHNDGGNSLANWAAIYQEHLSNCNNCHGYTNADGQNSPPLALNTTTVASGTSVHCLTCHSEKAVGQPSHGLHMEEFGKTAACTTSCHTGSSVLVNIHGNGIEATCTICHSNATGTRNNEIAGAGASGIDGDATLANGVAAAGSWSATGCLACHAAGGGANNFSSVGGMHHDNKSGNLICATPGCHSAAKLTHSTSVLVDPNCGTCHDTVAANGNARDAISAPFVGPGEVHLNKGGCTTCHSIDSGVGKAGGLRTSGLPVGMTLSDNGTPAGVNGSDGGGNCSACHGAYFASHGNADHVNLVATAANCADCHAGAVGDAATVPVSEVDNLIHDNCATCHETNGLLKEAYGLAQAMPDGGDGTNNGGGTCEACHTSGFNGFHQAVSHSSMVTNYANCSACHTAVGNTVDPADPKVHDACSVCHGANGRLLGAAADKDGGDIGGSNGGGTCFVCHGEYFASHSHANHETLVADAASCNTTGCHPATKGSATTVPVDGTPHTRLHDSCATCHALNGLLKTGPLGAAALMPAGTAATNDGGGVCTACHSTFTLASHANHNHLVSYAPATDLSNTPATPCASCHNDSGNSLATWAAIYQEHLSDCGTCHGYSNADGQNSPPAVTNTSLIANSTAATCQNCHTEKAVGQPDHDRHMADFGKTPACTTSCHSGASVLDNIHGNGSTATCTMCHSLASGSRNNEIAGAAANGIDGDATLANGTAAAGTWSAVDCLTCHSAGTGANNFTSVGGMHHDNKGGNVTCATVGCHSDSTLPHLTSVRVDPNCGVCHDTVAANGNARDAISAPYIGPGEVHLNKGGCTTCHLIDPGVGKAGGLRTTGLPAGITIPDSATPAWVNGSDGGGECEACHSGGFNGFHQAVAHTTMVSNYVNCSSCHTAVGNSVDPADPKVHDACAVCHDVDGRLIGSAAGRDGGDYGGTNGGGSCFVCHGEYFDSHAHGAVGGYVQHDVAFNAAVDIAQTGGATNACNYCHNDAGLVLGVTSLTTWEAIKTEHARIAGLPRASACATCHSYVTVGNLSGAANTPPVANVTAAIATGTGVTCVTCHVEKSFALSPATSHHDGSHSDSNFAWTSATQTSCGAANCHNYTLNSNVLKGIHGNGTVVFCGLCHVNPAGGGARRVGSDANATLGVPTATCPTCHAVKPTVGGMHHDTEPASRNNCTTNCHTVVNHGLKIVDSNSCNAVYCHADPNFDASNDSAAGTQPVATLVDPSNPMKHDACRTCHTFNATTWAGMLNASPGTKGVTTLVAGPCTGCHTQPLATFHHLNVNTTNGACTQCHYDPRNNTLDNTSTAYEGETPPAGGIPTTQLPCDECHVTPLANTTGWSGSMTISAWSEGGTHATNSYSTAFSRTVAHTAAGTGHVIPNTAGTIDNWGICFGCHDGAGSGKALSDLKPLHPAPTGVGTCQAQYAPGNKSAGANGIGRFYFLGASWRPTSTGSASVTGNATTSGTNCTGQIPNWATSSQAVAPGIRGAVVTLTVPDPWSTATKVVPVWSTPPDAPAKTAAATAVDIKVASAILDGTTLTVTATTSGSCSNLTLVNGAGNVNFSGTPCVAIKTGYVIASHGATVDVIDFPNDSIDVLKYRISSPAAAVDDTATANSTGVNNLLVMANDTGDGISITSVTQPSLGSVSISSGGTSVNYLGAGEGTTAFTYTITSWHGSSSTATVNLTVATDVTPPSVGPVTVTPTATTYTNAHPLITATLTDTGSAVTACEYTSNGADWLAGVVSGPAPTWTCTGAPSGLTGSLSINVRGTSPGGTGTGSGVALTVDSVNPTSGTLTVTPGNGRNDLSWTASTDANSGLRPTATYDLRFLTGATAPSCSTGVSLYTGTARSYAHTGLFTGQQYSYRVCGYDAVNNSSTGAIGSGTPVPAVTALDAWNNVYSAAAPGASPVAAGTITVGSGANRLLLVAISMEYASAANPSFGASLGGVALTQIATSSQTQREAVWLGYLKEASIGSGAKALAVTYNVNGGGTISSLHVKWASFTDVNQTTPVVSANARSSSTLTLANSAVLSYVKNGVTVAVAANGGTPATITMTATPTLTAGSIDTSNSSSDRGFTSATHTAAGSYAIGGISVTFAGTTSSRSALVAASLRP